MPKIIPPLLLQDMSHPQGLQSHQEVSKGPAHGLRCLDGIAFTKEKGATNNQTLQKMALIGIVYFI